MDSNGAASSIPKNADEEKRERKTQPLTWLAYACATGLGTGFSPIAPGTAGSILAVGLFLFLGHLSWSVQGVAILLLLFLGLWSAKKMEEDTGIHDDGRIVIDEWIGMWITLWALPVEWPFLIAGFGIFRILDITKPFPANWIDRKWKGEYGVIFDDVASGIYAAALLRAAEHLMGLL